MAIAVIGGLAMSTLLSLVFVPAVFTVLDDIGRLTWWLMKRFVGATDEPARDEVVRPESKGRPDEPTGAPVPAE
jgi:HAE1 family hydrophobic/amphiphilic exporter-1